MSFIDQIINGHRSVLKTMAIVFNYKVLLAYLLISSLVSAFVFSVASLLLGLGSVGIYNILQQWMQSVMVSLKQYVLLGLFLAIFLGAWIKIIFTAALLKRVMSILHRKSMTFSESFDFGKALSKKLFLWSLLFVVAVLLVIFSGIYFLQLKDYYLVQLLLIIWFVGTFLTLPVLVKRNLPLWKAIARSFLLTWHHIVEIISAMLAILFYMLLIGFIFGILGLGLTWGICYILNIPFGVGLIMPFVLVIIIPAMILSWYFSTVIMALPATLYHSVVDGLD